MSRSISMLERIRLTAGSAAMALANPARADMIAIVGDLTSGPVLKRVVTRVCSTAEGRSMIENLSPTRFPECIPGPSMDPLEPMRSLPEGSLGREYAEFMDKRGFCPKSRDVVRYVEDARERWALQRYRDVHDLWHVLTGMPTTFLGETGQKWFEAAHTGLPVAVLGGLTGPVRMSAGEVQVLATQLIPWAVRCGSSAENLLGIRYEDYLEEDVEELRGRWGVFVPEVHIKGMRRR